MPNVEDQLAAYRAAMGYEATVRQLAADGRDYEGTCKQCGAQLGGRHRDACPFLRRVVVERVNTSPPAA